MSNPLKHLVGTDAVRPAGKPDECFYCNRRLGSEHRFTCVMRTKTVKIRATIEYTKELPEHWDQDMVEFHLNESSWCSGNIIDDLEEFSEFTKSHGGCLCPFIEFEVLPMDEPTTDRDGGGK